MKLTVKTLEGKNFTVSVEDTSTIQEVKAAIEKSRPELPSGSQRLIHSGKILSDDATLQSTGVKETDFLVCMVPKGRKKPSTGASGGLATSSASSTPSPSPAPAPSSASSAAPQSTTVTASSTSTSGSTSGPTGSATNDATSSMASPEEAERIANLIEMGFPEDQARAALRAANGNPDVAADFLMNGLPEESSAPSTTPSRPPSTGDAQNSGLTLDVLRHHPQFNELRRIVQRDPSSLQTILQQIGSQNPSILSLIQQNQEEFIRMMNEPVDGENERSAATAGLAGMGNPQEAMAPTNLAHLVSSMTPEHRAALAQSLGIPVENFDQVAQLLASMNPEQLNQLLRARSGGSAGLGPFGMPSMAEGGDAGFPNLSNDDMGAVNRLIEMGFDRYDAVQAYLACDRNETLAANLLMDGTFTQADAQGTPSSNSNSTRPNPPRSDEGGDGSGNTREEDEDMHS